MADEELARLRELVSILCRNLSTSSTNATSEAHLAAEAAAKDKHALLYIVVVLLFYSTGIVIGIITYLKREKKEIEEEKAFDDYANFRSDPDKWVRYFRVQKMISYLNKVEEGKEINPAEHQYLMKHKVKGRSFSFPRGGYRGSALSSRSGVSPSAHSDTRVGRLRSLEHTSIIVNELAIKLSLPETSAQKRTLQKVEATEASPEEIHFLLDNRADRKHTVTFGPVGKRRLTQSVGNLDYRTDQPTDLTLSETEQIHQLFLPVPTKSTVVRLVSEGDLGGGSSGVKITAV